MMYKYNNATKCLRAIENCLLPVLMVILSVQPAAARSVIPFSRDRASSVAVVVRDLSTGRDIVSQNPHKAMLPASTMKCLTAAAAIEARLDTARFETKVYADGEISGGVLKGNLVIEGGGDPTTDSRQFTGHPGLVAGIADAVKNRGINEIEGCLIVDASSFPDNGPCDRWELSDLRYGYGAGLYALNYRDNAVGDKAMEAPSEVFGEALEEKLNALGITVGWDEPEQSGARELILLHRSPECSRILSSLMERSDNLFAEGMLRRLAPGQPLSAAISRERSLLSGIGIDLDVADIYDGSGLSRNNRVTAAVMADMLSRMADRKGADISYVSLFPRVGEDGTVKSLLKGTRLQGKLALKSGSMNGVHCYAGYKLDDAGKPTHAVVIFVNDFFCRRAEVRDAIAAFLKEQFR